MHKMNLGKVWIWMGMCVGFLALGKVGICALACVPCHVLKIAWGAWAVEG